MTEFIIKVLLPSALSSDTGTYPEGHHSPISVPHWQLRPPEPLCSTLSVLSPRKGTPHWARCNMTKSEISVNNIIDRAVESVPNARYCSLWLDKHVVSNLSCDGRFQTNMLLSLDKVSLSLPYCLATVD